MTKNRRTSRRGKLKRMNSRKASYKRKGKRTTQKYKKKIMRGGDNMQAKIKNMDPQYESVFVYRLPNKYNTSPPSELEKFENMGGTPHMLPNNLVVDVIDKTKWEGWPEKKGLYPELDTMVNMPGMKGTKYQIIKFVFIPVGMNPQDVPQGLSYGLVGSDHLDYDIPEPEPAPAPLTDEEKKTKCEEIKKLCMESRYDEAIAIIEEMRNS